MDSPGLEDAGLSFDDAALGHGLAPPVEALIAGAGLLRHDPQQAESLLLAARRQAPEHPAPLIALYRFYFYGHRLGDARVLAQDALDTARKALGPGFGQVAPSEAQARFDVPVRFYLFALKGYAYLSLRLGDIDAGRGALDELRRLDPQDLVGGAVLAQVLNRVGMDDDAADDDRSQRNAPRGWSTESMS